MLVRVIALAAYSALCLALSSPAGATEPLPQYNIKFDDPEYGSRIRLSQVRGSQIPINRRYDQLSSAERATLHGWWEHIPQGDEPPFPVDGLKPIHDAIRKAQNKMLVEGQLLLIANVGPDGNVTEVKVVGSPSPEMTKFAAAVLVLTKFKPAICAGKPCRMDFPLRYTFRVR